MANAVLLVACPDRRGIVAALATFVDAQGGNIVDLQQHTDHTDAVVVTPWHGVLLPEETR